jgi:hypothetical protein
MTPPDPALVGALVVAAVGVSADIYFVGGAKFARDYEKEREKFYKSNWEACRDMDEAAGISFTRALITSELWRLGVSGGPTAGSPADDEAAVRLLEVKIRERTKRVRSDLENLTTQFRARTGNKEKLEKTLGLFDKCAALTRKAWAAFAILVSALAILFALYVSVPASFNPAPYWVLGITALGSGAVTFDAATDWNRDNAALKKCKDEIETAIHSKIHFPESDVAGLQAPPPTPGAPQQDSSGGAVGGS